MVVALPAAAHPGPEPHPTVEELEEVVSEIRSAIDEVDWRLGERIDDLEALASEPKQQVIAADFIEREVDEAVVELVQSSNELKDWVNTVVSIGAMLIAVLIGVSAFLGFQVRALKRRPSRLSQPASEAQEVNANPIYGGKREDEERIVTHTLKESIGQGTQPTIKELHNPSASWSPRTVEEAISDIDKGIQYWALGPEGNKAEIEVRKGPTKRYLRTKADEHSDNNLEELPDPPLNPNVD